MVYISGNMFLYYVPGKKRRHVSPDVFLVRGIPNKDRDAYFVWEEGKGPDVVFEYTSPSTRDEDLNEKYQFISGYPSSSLSISSSTPSRST